MMLVAAASLLLGAPIVEQVRAPAQHNRSLTILQPKPCSTGGLYSSCIDSGCCADASLACYKRAGREFAQCRPRNEACVDTDEWECPGWELCAPRFGNCFKSQCCKHAGDVCYQKDREFAQCRALGDCYGRADPQTKVPWSCAVLHPPDVCSPDWQECSASKCCSTLGFTCFEVHAGYSRCMRDCPDPAAPAEWRDSFSCAINDKHQLDTRALLPRHVAPGHTNLDTCSPNHGECTVSACCQSGSHTCYEHGPHFAMCLPTGSCSTFWPAESRATCAVHQPSTACAGPSGDCSQSHCCADAAQTCFQKDGTSHEARCMRGCSGDGDLAGWQCNVIDKTKRSALPPPAAPPPPPAPLYHSSYGTVCTDFARRTSIHARSCAEFTDPVACNAHHREGALRPSTPFAHVLEPCGWIMIGRSAGHCAQGDPIECTPAMVNSVLSAP